MRTQNIVVPESEFSDAKSDVAELASATLAAFHPYINIYDCGKKLWDEKTKKHVPMHMITQEAFVFGNRYQRMTKQQRKSFKPVFTKGKKQGKQFHYWAHYLSGILDSKKISEGINETESYYYTGSQRRRCMPYFDIDAHHGEQDELEARMLLNNICGGLWNPSPRGQNGYIKLYYGAVENPVLSDKIFGGLSDEQICTLKQKIQLGLKPSEVNALLARAQQIYRRYLKCHDIACDFEIKGEITEHHPTVRSGSLAKLPLKGWSWDRLDEFNVLPEIYWYVWERQLDLLEKQLDQEEACSMTTPESKQQPLASATESAEKPARIENASEPDSCAFTRNRRDCLSFVRSFYRQNGRTPTHDEFLQHLRTNRLFTGNWNDPESDRDSRSARVLKFVLQTFDPNKIGNGSGQWNDFPVQDWIRQYARQNYGSINAVITKGRNEVSFADNGLVESGQRVQKCKVPAAFVHHCVWVILTCLEDLADNDGLPENRIVKAWSKLPGKVPSFNRDYYAIVRKMLEDRSVIDIYDKNHRARKCWRWRKGENYPTSPNELKAKLDRIRSVRTGIGFSDCSSFSSSQITPYCKAVAVHCNADDCLALEQRPPPKASL